MNFQRDPSAQVTHRRLDTSASWREESSLDPARIEGGYEGVLGPHFVGFGVPEKKHWVGRSSWFSGAYCGLPCAQPSFLWPLTFIPCCVGDSPPGTSEAGLRDPRFGFMVASWPTEILFIEFPGRKGNVPGLAKATLCPLWEGDKTGESEALTQEEVMTGQEGRCISESGDLTHLGPDANLH